MRGIPLIDVFRGGVLESRHLGSFAVVQQGRLLRSGGTPEAKFYFRSSAKPIQAIPTVITGTAAAFRLTAEELSATCGSHKGEPIHVEIVLRLLKRAGLTEAHLQCGPDWPGDETSKLAAIRAEPAPRRVFHNCSGKHAGMLLNCVHNGWPVENYLDPGHPLQQMILGYIAEFAGARAADIHISVDGCGAPVFYLSLIEMATAFSELAKPCRVAAPVADACRVVATAMESYPRQFSGLTSFCHDLCQCGKGRWVNKGGAEAVYALGVHASGIGIALKCHDGHNRGRNGAIVHLLDQLGLLTEEDRCRLRKYSHAPIKNSQDKDVGFIQPAFSL